MHPMINSTLMTNVLSACHSKHHSRFELCLSGRVDGDVLRPHSNVLVGLPSIARVVQLHPVQLQRGYLAEELLNGYLA